MLLLLLCLLLAATASPQHAVELSHRSVERLALHHAVDEHNLLCACAGHFAHSVPSRYWQRGSGLECLGAVHGVQ
jgi:hypothetical protein